MHDLSLFLYSHVILYNFMFKQLELNVDQLHSNVLCLGDNYYQSFYLLQLSIMY